jgi:hypothetical protein
VSRGPGHLIPPHRAEIGSTTTSPGRVAGLAMASKRSVDLSPPRHPIPNSLHRLAGHGSHREDPSPAGTEGLGSTPRRRLTESGVPPTQLVNLSPRWRRTCVVGRTVDALQLDLVFDRFHTGGAFWPGSAPTSRRKDWGRRRDTVLPGITRWPDASAGHAGIMPKGGCEAAPGERDVAVCLRQRAGIPIHDR